MGELWNFNQLEFIDSSKINFSSGFIASKPARWVPNFSAHWVPLFQSLNINVKVISVTPSIDLPKIDQFWVGTFEDEALCLNTNKDTAASIAKLFLNSEDAISISLVQEYLVIRFLTSLSNSWSGPSLPKLYFYSEGTKNHLNIQAGIKVVLSIHDEIKELWLLIGPKLLKTLDGLWQRQTSSFASKQFDYDLLALEIDRINVPISDLNKYFEKGNRIAIGFSGNDPVSITSKGEVVSLAKLFRSNDSFVVQTISPANIPEYKPNMVVVSFILGEFTLPTEKIPSLTTVGSYLSTNINLSSKIILQIDNKNVAEGSLMFEDDHYFVMVE